MAIPSLMVALTGLAAAPSSANTRQQHTPLENTPQRVHNLIREYHNARNIVIAPSVAKADFYHLGHDLNAAVDAGAQWLHFSVQDGRMVPKVSFGSPVIAALRPHFPDTVFDVKLGCIEPMDRVSEFAKAGADIISVHPEATLQLPAVLHAIAEAGCAPGVVLNPGTPLAAIEHVLDQVDVVVVMLVNPGHGGPKYMAAALDKIARLRQMIDERGLKCWIEVDGGVSTKNAPELIAAGATALVAGGSIFTADDKRAAVRELMAPSDFMAP